MRTRILMASLVVTLVGTSVFLACSSDSSTTASNTADGGKSSTSSSGTSGTTTSGGDGAVSTVNNPPVDFAALDGGCAAAPASITCVLHCTGYMTATVTASTPRTDIDAGGPGIAWTNTNNAEVADGQFATVTLNDGEESQSLDVSGFGFDLPDSDSTYGVAVEFSREAVGSVFDAHFTLLVENPTPNLPVDHQDESIWPETQIGVHHYGQCVDTWELDLNPSDVNKPTFGARVSVKRGPDAGTGPVTANVDGMRVNVCYCEGSH